jgi:hypothetical protein
LGTVGKQGGITVFREIVIDPDLKGLLNIMLRAASPEEPAVYSAKRRIRAMTSPESCYLFASMTRSYLEEKTRIGTEQWVFPVAGDLFLDALETNIATVGPRLLRNHYSDMVGCYRAGDCPAKVIQGTLYCIDLILQKILDIHVNKDRKEKGKMGLALSFESSQDLEDANNVIPYLGLARQCLQDAVDATLKMAPSSAKPSFMNFLIAHKERMQAVLGRWETYHRNPALSNWTEEQYLEGVWEMVEEIGYLPLTATVEEYRVRLRERQSGLVKEHNELEQEVHPLYYAATMYVSQGSEARESEAYDLAFRWYNRAAALFTKIQDRTSTAKVHVERARAFIKSADDPESMRDELNKAVALVLAHMRGLPRGTLPEVTHDMAIQFLKSKGYVIESEAYETCLKR